MIFPSYIQGFKLLQNMIPLHSLSNGSALTIITMHAYSQLNMENLFKHLYTQHDEHVNIGEGEVYHTPGAAELIKIGF